ncbi:MAG: sugar phosphate isomerase/epimerase [Crenarchaeota archaeon]|nr:sugar phosphate isomerase/epimerase [Thermoproteota archaeon]
MLYAGVRKRGLELVARFPWRIGVVVFMLYPQLLKSDEGAGDRILEIIHDPVIDLYEVSHMRDEEWSKVASFVGYKTFALALQPEVLVRGLNPNDLDESKRRAASAELASLIRKAGERGMVAAALCSGPNVPNEKKAKAIESLVKTLRELAEAASHYKMNLYLETFDYNRDKKRLIGPIDLAARVIEEVRQTHPNTYIMWDLSHSPLLNEEPDVLRSYPDLIGHIHIGCAKRVDERLVDWHPGFYRPGSLNSEIEVAKLLAVLHDIGYRGAISFEIKPEEGQTPREALASAKAALLHAFQLFLKGSI